MGFLRAERDYLGYRTGKNSTLYNIVGGLGYFRDDVVSFFSSRANPSFYDDPAIASRKNFRRDMLSFGLGLGATASLILAPVRNSLANIGHQLVGGLQNLALSLKGNPEVQSAESVGRGTFQLLPDIDNPIALTTAAAATFVTTIAIGRAGIRRNVDRMVNEHGALSSDFNDPFDDDYEPEGYDGRAIDAQLKKAAQIISNFDALQNNSDKISPCVENVIAEQRAERQESKQTPLELVQDIAVDPLRNYVYSGDMVQPLDLNNEEEYLALLDEVNSAARELYDLKNEKNRLEDDLKDIEGASYKWIEDKNIDRRIIVQALDDFDDDNANYLKELEDFYDYSSAQLDDYEARKRGRDADLNQSMFNTEFKHVCCNTSVEAVEQEQEGPYLKKLLQGNDDRSCEFAAA